MSKILTQSAADSVPDFPKLDEASIDASSECAQTQDMNQPMDWRLLLATLVLSCLGLVMVYSASLTTAFQTHGEWNYFLQRQGIFFGIGLISMLLSARMDYRILRRFAPHLMVVGLLGLVLVLLIGVESHGARRWIHIGFSIQPSEAAKLALAVFLAAMLAKQGEQVRSFRSGFLPVIAISSLTMILVLLERDLGTTILIGVLTLTMLFIAGTRISYVVAAVMLAAPIIWQQIVEVAYRRGRVIDFLSGEQSYQIKQSLIAIGSGGAWGLGLGAGRQKLGFLPENHTDFILASLGEELGLFGIALVICVFALLTWRGLKIAQHAPDRFGAYLAMAITSLLAFQALVNMGVVLDLLPAKGITLPFLSSGGSSLVISMTAVGVLLSISRRPTPWRISDQRNAVPKKVKPSPKLQKSDRRPNRKIVVPEVVAS